MTSKIVSKENLIKLANGLLNDNRRRTRFTMAVYSADGGAGEMQIECGSVGCAIGHAPFYGIEKNPSESWFAYSRRTLINRSTDDSSESRWCFSGDWAPIDNTKTGAAQRIIYLLQYGLPDTWKSQMDGDTPICYQHIQEFCSQWLKENTQ